MMEITDYFNVLGININVSFRTKSFRQDNDELKFYASCHGVDEVSKNLIKGIYGNGSTPDEAVKDYAKQLSNKTIRTQFKGQFTVPELVHTKEI